MRCGEIYAKKSMAFTGCNGLKTEEPFQSQVEQNNLTHNFLW